MVPAASGLVVLSRIPSSAITSAAASWIGIIVIIVFLYSSFRWFFDRNDLSSRPFWMISMASCGILSVLSRHPEAAISWGVAMIFVGSSLFLLDYANRFMRVLLGIGLISMVGLPLTANASGIEGIFNQANWFFVFPVIFGLWVFMVGMAEKVLLKPEIPQKQEQIIYLTYPLSILILILSYLFVGLFGWRGSRIIGNWPVSVFLFSITIAWLVWDRRTGRPAQWLLLLRERTSSTFNQPLIAQIRRVVDFQWILVMVRYLYNSLGWLVRQLTFLLEGNAGIFWAILLMVLFIAVLNLGGA
jgi:hypothetical protein